MHVLPLHSHAEAHGGLGFFSPCGEENHRQTRHSVMTCMNTAYMYMPGHFLRGAGVNIEQAKAVEMCVCMCVFVQR